MRTNGHGRPVVALDIDGSLGDYHRNFIEFARRYFNNTESDWMRDNPGLPLWVHMGIEQHKYREAKLAYRQGGWKRWMPCYPWASELTQRIRSAGADVWLCTTRPYLRLDNVDPDTREWLNRNQIQYDALLFDRVEEKGSKYDELFRQAGGRVASVLEDLPEMAHKASSIWGSDHVTLRDQPYNRHVAVLRRARDLQEAWGFIERDLQRFRHVR